MRSDATRPDFAFYGPFEKIANAYGVNATPSAVVITPDGRIGSPPADGARPIRQLAMETVDRVRFSLDQNSRPSVNRLNQSSATVDNSVRPAMISARAQHQIPPATGLALAVGAVTGVAACGNASTQNQSWPTAAGLWTGTLSYQSDSVQVRIHLKEPAQGSLSGVMQFSDPVDHTFVDAGLVTGENNPNSTSWHTDAGVAFVGKIRSGSWSGEVRFPKIQGSSESPLLIPVVNLRRG